MLAPMPISTVQARIGKIGNVRRSPALTTDNLLCIERTLISISMFLSLRLPTFTRPCQEIRSEVQDASAEFDVIGALAAIAKAIQVADRDFQDISRVRSEPLMRHPSLSRIDHASKRSRQEFSHSQDPKKTFHGRCPDSLNRRLEFTQLLPEAHVHLAVHRRGGGVKFLRLFVLAHPPVDFPKAEAAVGNEGTHSLHFGEG